MLDYIGLAVIAQTLTWAGPIRELKSRLTRFPLLVELLDCSICLSFWIGLIMWGNLVNAGLLMFTTKIIETIYAYLPVKIS